MTTPEPLVICTAWNSAFSKQGEFCSESILQHIRRVEERGGSGITFLSQLIPDDYPRPPSWYKLSLIDKLLMDNPHVLWVDADTLLIDQGDIREGMNLSPQMPLQITWDENGINAGVMWWNQGGDAPGLLKRIEDLSGEHLNHKWWETAAMQRDFRDNPEDYLEIEKVVYNAYTNEINPRTKIVHYAGFKNDQRLKLMEAQEIAIRRNGHGPKR